MKKKEKRILKWSTNELRKNEKDSIEFYVNYVRKKR